MAQGDFEVFSASKEKMGDGVFALGADTHKLALTDGSTTDPPTENLGNPLWGTTGTPVPNFELEEVTPGGNYPDEGTSISAVITDNWSLSTNIAKFDGDDVTAWTQNAGNPTDAKYGILYDDTLTNNDCIGWLDIGGVFNMTTGDLTVTWAAAGIFTLT